MSRRSALLAVGAGVSTALAGCLGVDHDRQWSQPLDGTPNSMARITVDGSDDVVLMDGHGRLLAIEIVDER